MQLSSEAINLFLNALDLDIESEQIANEAVVQFQLERGNFDKARTGAETARGRSLQYEQKTQGVIAQTKRDIRRVNWRKDVHQTLVEANEHVEGRLRIEENILRSAREKLTSIGDGEENRVSLAAVIRLMGDCRSRHLRLNKHLMTARSEFIEQQSRQCFIDSLRTAPIHLRDDVLAPILRLACTEAIRLSEHVGHAFIGPITPRLLSLRELLGWELQPRRVQSIGEVPVEELEFVETHVERQRVYKSRPGLRMTEQGNISPSSTQGLIRKHLQQLVEHGCFTVSQHGTTEMYRPTLRYQIQVRELAASKLYEEIQKLAEDWRCFSGTSRTRSKRNCRAGASTRRSSTTRSE